MSGKKIILRIVNKQPDPEDLVVLCCDSTLTSSINHWQSIPIEINNQGKT